MSDNAHLESLRVDLNNRLQSGIGLESAAEMLRALQRQLFAAVPALLETRLAALEKAIDEYKERLNRATYLQKRSIRDGRDLWYAGASPDNTIWHGLRGKLEAAGRNIEQVDSESDVVVGLLTHPDKPAFKCKGLVVGHVQSGKTGNIAAVIAKASETKYKFFLVLSGMTDQLRDQTQRRLQADVVAMDPSRWYSWTSADELNELDGSRKNGDFSHKAVGGFVFDNRNQIAVVKKEPNVLRKVLAKLQNTDAASLRDTPFLIIDDEADQASVNSAKYRDEISKINQTLRQLVEVLPRVSYVGYTATPFANILIDTTAPQDLYPRDFIFALEKSEGYFGAEELFGQAVIEGAHDAEDTDPGFDMIRTVSRDDALALRGAHGAAHVPDSLRDALHYFVLVVAARIARAQRDEHNTMLVHTSVNTLAHESLEKLVSPLLADLCSRLKASDSVLIETLGSLWRSEHERVLSERFDLAPLSFEQIQTHLVTAASSIEVVVENYVSDRRLSYRGNGKSQVVIGGNVLSRGLTLEGLCVSYFIRATSQYDTLMQMGRWFGYRRGYADLPRVWVEDIVRDRFLDLSKVEAEIRKEIARYAEEQITPTDFAVRIRKIPGMAITARTKMRHAVNVSIDFEGEHVQTFRFNRNNRPWLQKNWESAGQLVDACSSATELRGSHRLLRNVPANLILEFLVNYSAHESHRDLAPALLRKYVEDRSRTDGRYATWTVAVVGGEGGKSISPLGRLGNVTTVIRSALSGVSDDANIKALMSWSDVLIDLPDAQRQGVEKSWAAHKERRHDAGGGPLLLLYPIEARSAPKGGQKGANRVPLDASMDVLGMGIVFPGRKSAGSTYVSANLEPEDAAAEDESDSVFGSEAADSNSGNLS